MMVDLMVEKMVVMLVVVMVVLKADKMVAWLVD